jgi:hypothetical protein
LLCDKFSEVSAVFLLADWSQEIFEDVLRPEALV